MMHAESLPAWAALLTAFLVLLGAGLTLIGAIGTLRFGTFFERVHASTLGTSWGTGAIALASIVCFAALGSRSVAYEILIGVFIAITAPVTLMLLSRAALYRDRTGGIKGIPARSVMRPPQGKDRPGGLGTAGDEPPPSAPESDG